MRKPVVFQSVAALLIVGAMVLGYAQTAQATKECNTPRCVVVSYVMHRPDDGANALCWFEYYEKDTLRGWAYPSACAYSLSYG